MTRPYHSIRPAPSMARTVPGCRTPAGWTLAGWTPARLAGASVALALAGSLALGSAPSSSPLALLSPVTPAQGAECGGPFGAWKTGVAREARAAGVSRRTVERIVPDLAISNSVLKRDRDQGVFAQTWIRFASKRATDERLRKARRKIEKNPRLFARVEREYGVDPAVITALWGLETDFSAGMGRYNTLNALATLAHDCRRPDLFRPELIGALKLVDSGAFSRSTKGAWAGEIGGTQMLPNDIIAYGRDGNGDGVVDLKGSGADVVLSTAAFLRGLGWRPGEPWLEEVSVPERFDWSAAGRDIRLSRAEWTKRGVSAREGTLPPDAMPAALIAPQGRKGPKFLAYPNFDVFTEWNKSYVYSLTAAYTATRIKGAPRANVGKPERGIDVASMKRLQEKLAARGHDVGRIDGILGLGTRAAVRAEQQRLGMPADSWPTPKLLKAL